MSGYLTRLVSRTRGAGNVQSLQPIVRSTSPIAERDQRIGMAGFEGFEFGGSLIPDVGLEAADHEQGETLQRTASRHITGIKGTGELTVQRKGGNPTTESTRPPVSAVPSMASTMSRAIVKKTRLVKPSLGQSDGPLRSQVQAINQNRQFASSGSGSGSHTETHHDSVRPLVSPLAAQPQTPAVGTSSIAAPKKEISSSDHTQPDDLLGQVNRESVHVRSAWQSSQLDTPFLKPSPRAIAEHEGATSKDADMPLSDVDGITSVVIGRVNVEVVPPSVTPASTSPQSGPLTAASASVIGPLGRNVCSHWGLGLRSR